MDLSFNDDQKQLQDALAKFIERDYGFDKRKAYQKSPEGFSREVWAQFAEMGLLALPFADEDGGLGGGAAELLVAMGAIGGGLMVEPYLPTVLAGAAVSRAGNAAQKSEFIGAVAEGKCVASIAFQEPGARFDLAQVSTTAKKWGNEYVISGAKAVVINGAQADRLVVSARTSGGANDTVNATEGLSLFLIDAKAKGVIARDYRTIDGLRAADITFDNVKVPAAALLGAEGAAWEVMDAVADAGAAALCAEGVGVMESLNRQTLAYLKERKQFGVAIGSFQALQHRAVDMFMHAEQSKSMAYLAAIKAPVIGEAASAAERRRSVSAAKVYIGNAGRVVAQEAIQLHGGMGMTNELAAAHYAKRLTMIDFVLGDSAHHLARFESAR